MIPVQYKTGKLVGYELSATKFLDIEIDDNLQWDPHKEYNCNKLNAVCYVFKCCE